MRGGIVAIKLVAVVAASALTLACAESEHPPAPSTATAPAETPARAAPAADVTVTTTSNEARAAFEKGRDLQLNTREPEAIAEFKKALALDPNFVFAKAWLGYLTLGDEGTQLLDKAMAARDKLPEPERLSIEQLAALRAGDRKKASEIAQKIVALLPFDWRAQLDLGNRLYDERKYEESVAHFSKAAAFGPKTPAVYNALGYGLLMQRRVDAAVYAFRKYAELKPDEPNALDSLGEALMSAGKLDEAEQSFQKAADAGFSFAWDGVAETRFLRGNWAGGFEANARAKQDALRAIDKLDADANACWALLAKGDRAEADKRIDALDKDAQGAKYDEMAAMSSVLRAVSLADSGKDGDANGELQKAIDRGKTAKLPGIAQNRVNRLALSLRAIVATRIGAADADKVAAEIGALGHQGEADLDQKSLEALGKGAALLAKGDAKAAVGELSHCVDQDSFCRYALLLAEDKAGDATTAGLTRDRLVSMNLREYPYLWVRAKSSMPAARSSASIRVLASALNSPSSRRMVSMLTSFLRLTLKSVAAVARSLSACRFWLITMSGPWSATRIASTRLKKT
jgi:Flp pilus assembly protein TadD